MGAEEDLNKGEREHDYYACGNGKMSDFEQFKSSNLALKTGY